jgi:hypothetical protein
MDLYSTDAALWWEGHLEIDADGAPNAYGPLGTACLDYLANAGKDGDWYGIVTDTGKGDGKPLVQGPQDPCPGHYISTTALVNHALPESNPLRFVDSASVPYLSVPSDAEHGQGVALGDVCLAYNRLTNKFAAGVVADIGPKGKYGEGSIAMAQKIGVKNVSPKNGGQDSGIVCVVFKNSSKGWPRTLADINDQVTQLLAAAGGLAAFIQPQS